MIKEACQMVSAALRRVGGDDVRELVEWHCDWDLPVEEAYIYIYTHNLI